MGRLANLEHSYPHYKYTTVVRMQSVEGINVKAAFNLL